MIKISIIRTLVVKHVRPEYYPNMESPRYSSSRAVRVWRRIYPNRSSNQAPGTLAPAEEIEYTYRVAIAAGSPDRDRPRCEPYPQSPLIARLAILASGGALGNAANTKEILQNELRYALDNGEVPQYFEGLLEQQPQHEH